MYKRLQFLFISYSFWVLYFILARFIFIIYHLGQFKDNQFIEIAKTFGYGILLDFSISAYLSVLPFLLVLVSFFSQDVVKKIFPIYTYSFLVITALMIMADLELFSAWGFRLDISVWNYMKSPKEAWASSLSSPFLKIFALGFILLFIGFSALKYIVFTNLDFEKTSFKWIPLFLLLSALLIIPIRGGLQLAPINQSSVFFSNQSILNQTAINCVWNFAFSIGQKSYQEENPYNYYPSDDILIQKFNQLKQLRKADTLSILNTSRPNIILIIWESGTSKAQLKYDGYEIVPELKQLMKEGVYFEQCYASGNRTDKGLIAILSGYPAHPTSSIITNPIKSEKLPSIIKSLKPFGYSSSFIYGGETEFANIKSYLLSSGFEKIISKDDFEENQWNSKWGAHDEYAFERLMKLNNQAKVPFFSTLLTLTSHEPFEIPSKPLLKTDTRERLFLNAMHYTDSCLGDFIKKAKKSDWWKNALVVIVADHGSPLPGSNVFDYLPQDFHIPLLFIGGAIKPQYQNYKIKHTVSQSDFPSILLSQLGIDASAYPFSDNVIKKPPYPSAFYVFNDGFGFISDSIQYLHNNISNQRHKEELKANPEHIAKGKAYLQYSVRDYIMK
ncbi:MAG: alkaline phosphatase family protein [Cytophagales bacterium]|nr:MAG: alkaline phosphatase family protein [Cytophagales bacterium]